jgi:lipoprotein-releasing system permease protein
MLQNELGVLHVQKVAMKGGLLKSEADFEGIVYKGVASDYKWENLEGFMVEGRFPRFMDRPSKEIIISKVIADRLSVAVGDELTAYFQNSLQQKVPNIRKFEVTGLFLSGFPDFDQNFVIGDLQHVQRINKWNPEEIGAYEVFTSDITALQSIANSIYAKLPSDLDAVEITRQYATIFQWISLFDFNILIIIIVMIIVGVINMSTALLVLILERTRMIGLFKTIGAGNRLIRKIFLYNGIVIMGYGLFWGNLTGLLFYFSQKYFGWIRLDPETYYVNTAPVSLNLFDLLSINAGVLIVSSLLLLIPLAIISSIRPARVLRYR